MDGWPQWAERHQIGARKQIAAGFQAAGVTFRDDIVRIGRYFVLKESHFSHAHDRPGLHILRQLPAKPQPRVIREVRNGLAIVMTEALEYI